VPRRKLEIHESMKSRPTGDMMSALAAKLGVAMPEADTQDAPEPSSSGEEALGDPIVAPDEVISRHDDVTTSDPPTADPQLQAPAILLPQHRDLTLQDATAAPVAIDARIIAARGKQPLYVRLPREMHEFLEDLSYRLTKINRDASMTNLVAQAIVDKYPESLQVTDRTE
jgi:hypothetical protein